MSKATEYKTQMEHARLDEELIRRTITRLGEVDRPRIQVPGWQPNTKLTFQVEDDGTLYTSGGRIPPESAKRLAVWILQTYME